MPPHPIEANARPIIALAALTRSIGSVLLLMVIGAALQSCGKEQVTLRGHSLALASVAYSPDGKYLATGSYDKTAKVWDTNTNRELITLVGHQGTVEAVAFSPDGTRLATGSYDGTVKLWDWAVGKEVATFKGHTNMIRSLAYSPDGRTIASGSHDNTIKLWDVATGTERATRRGGPPLGRRDSSANRCAHGPPASN